MAKTYEDQVLEQIEQYRETEAMHDLPEIFHRWSADYVAPGLQSVFGVTTINNFYVEAFLSAAKATPTQPAFLSLGCGDGAVEIEIAQTLLARGMQHFRFTCLDLSAPLLNRFRAAIPPHLTPHFELLNTDLNAASLPITFDAIMANHSLHHILDLEGVYKTAYNHLTEHGIFATSDMIGRNGHMRWPEARLFVDFFWPFLTQPQRHNVQLNRNEPRFTDHDCATEGFEGIRAQEVLPLLLAGGFHPARFFAFGGITDVFTDRCFGPNFDVNNPDDLFLARRIGFLNELLLDAGLVKPTMMLAWFTKQPGPEIAYRTRTAHNAIRPPNTDPTWLKTALSDFQRAPDPPNYAFRTRNAQNPPSAELARCQARLAALEASTSWRITAPLRGLMRQIRKR